MRVRPTKRSLTVAVCVPLAAGLVVGGALFLGAGGSVARADPLDELAKLDPFRPAPQIHSLPTAHGLWFRNQTNETVYVAIDHHVSGASSISVGDYNLPAVVPDGWMVIGWFEVPPKKMIQVLSGNLDNRYYYYYAKSKSSTWEGKVHKYVHPTKKFSYDSTDKKKVGHLKDQGYVLKGFHQIDTGNATGFTMNLKK
jgi:uncharacterized membrane protein